MYLKQNKSQFVYFNSNIHILYQQLIMFKKLFGAYLKF